MPLQERKQIMPKQKDIFLDSGVCTTTNNDQDKIDIRKILNSNKFIPIWLQRNELEKHCKLPPYSVELHLTSTCNYNCYHCSYANRRKSATYLEEDIIDGIIDNLTSSIRPKGVYFSGGGEPTTLKNWDRYISRLTDNGIEVSLITNGSLLKQQHLPTLSKLNYIAISIYSSNNDTANKITGTKNKKQSFTLPKEIKNHSEKIVVGARCVINKFNYTEITDTYQKAVASGYDYVIFIPEVDYEKRGLSLSMEQIDEMIEKTSTCSIDNKKTNLASLVKNKFHFYPQAYDKEIFNSIDCQAIRLRTNAFINYDGGIYLCQPHIGNQKYCIGNLHEKRLDAIWNSKKHKEVINSLSKQWKAGLCANCRSIGFNKSIYEYINTESNQPIEITKDSFV